LEKLNSGDGAHLDAARTIIRNNNNNNKRRKSEKWGLKKGVGIGRKGKKGKMKRILIRRRECGELAKKVMTTTMMRHEVRAPARQEQRECGDRQALPLESAAHFNATGKELSFPFIFSFRKQ
jgi:hypothetical protein